MNLPLGISLLRMKATDKLNDSPRLQTRDLIPLKSQEALPTYLWLKKSLWLILRYSPLRSVSKVLQITFRGF